VFFVLEGILKLIILQTERETAELNGDLLEAYEVNINYMSIKCSPHGEMDIVKYVKR
jgi:hypothetical protein